MPQKGFLLQIEGGRVDHAGHADDLAGLLYDQMAYEDAVKVAVDFARKSGDTLVIITADHATGGPSLNGAGEEYIDSTNGLLSAQKMKASYQTLMPLLSRAANAEAIRELMNEKLGVALKPTEADAILQSLKGMSPFAVSEFLRRTDGDFRRRAGKPYQSGVGRA